MSFKDKLDTNKLYTSKQIIKDHGLRFFQDILASGQIDWVQDDTDGNKLYRVMV